MVSIAARCTGCTCRSTPMSRTSSAPVSVMPGAPAVPVRPITIDETNDRASRTQKPSSRYLRRRITAAMPAAPQMGTSHWNVPTEVASTRSIGSMRPSQPSIASSLSRRSQYTTRFESPTARA
ncbi:hypothetical protein GCM10009733_088120 [Nonomuraea maheshkhaliensis]|uniref:Uncharacterized protein n=1 Tax=Nonomuraea maheshkhaliensis TaxID=419590 RepID=A0ABN2GVL9_9ACTN